MKKMFAGLMLAAAMSPLAGCTAEMGAPVEEGTLGNEGEELTCSNPQGTDAMIAALAVAMGRELGRWEILTDFEIYKDDWTQDNLRLSAAGNAQCTANGSQCKNIKNLLRFMSHYTDKSIYFKNQSGGYDMLSWSSYASRLVTGMKNMTSYKKNNQYKYPAHKVAYTSQAPGGCDTIFQYSVTKPDGTLFTNAADVTAIENALLFGSGNGVNGFIAADCHSSVNTCKVDPTGNVVEGDNSSQATVWACQKYSPDANLTGQPCSCPAKISTNSGAGKMGIPDPNASATYKCEKL